MKLRGNNSLNLCPAAMQDIVQYYLDQALELPVIVKNIRYDSPTCTFIINFEDSQNADSKSNA